MDNRLDSLKTWLNDDLKLPLTSIDIASADASFRRYFRITIDPKQLTSLKFKHLPSTLIVMDSPPEHEDNALFAYCTEVLQECYLNIPTIYFIDLEQGFLVIKDLGTQTFDKELNTETADNLYKDASAALITMQSQAQKNVAPIYSAEKLKEEMALFEDWYIGKHHDSSLSQYQTKSLSTIKNLLVQNALDQEQVLVHRDYHCRNLLVTEQNNPGIIDYQDMVIGPITYDLASIFKDCYIEWPRKKVEEWVISFQDLALQNDLTKQKCPDQWLKWFDLMAVQRHLKVLGIFCRLYYRDGKSQYMKDLNLTYKYLFQACKKYPELSSLADILEQYACTNN